MCLVLLAFKAHPDYPLILATNRDEFYGRPAKTAHFWEDAPHVLAGRDEEAGGTWCGVNLDRSFAAVTNYREAPDDDRPYRSRGELVADFLRNDLDPQAYLNDIHRQGEEYRGFNLLLGNERSIWYYSNRAGAPREVQPGIHGLSNHLLNTPWFKVERGREQMRALIDDDRIEPDALFEVLASEDRAEDADLPETGFGRVWERALSASFIHTEQYGTRSSTVLLVDRSGNLDFRERTFDRGRMIGEEQVFALPADAPAEHQD